MENVKCVKLVSGEDIICQFEENLISSKCVVRDPIQIAPVPSRNGEPNFMFIPYPLYTKDKELTIPIEHIIFVCEPAEEFENQYTSLLTGIVTPPKKLIV